MAREACQRMPRRPPIQGDRQQQGRHSGSLDRPAPSATTLNSPTPPPGHQLPRFNFWRGGEDEKGSVIRVPEKHGNWVNFNDLTTLVDQYQDEINSLRERIARLEPKSVKP